MRYFLIDFENTQIAGLTGIEKLNSKDKVIIFYSKNANKITFDAHRQIMASPADITYMEIESLGHNALDFNLVYFLGQKAGSFRGSKLECYIISKDSGYDTLKNNPFDKENKIKIYRFNNIEKAINRSPLTQQDIVNNILDKENLIKHSKITMATIEISATKAELHNNLIKRIGKEEGLKVYSAVRPEFLKIKETSRTV